MTNTNIALIEQAALAVPRLGPTQAPKRITDRTSPKQWALEQIVPGNLRRDAERRLLQRSGRGREMDSFLGVRSGAQSYLWAALSELWVRGWVRQRTWPWAEDPLAFLIEVNPQFWLDTLVEMDVQRLMWPLNGSGTYPHAKFHRALTNALVIAKVLV